MWCRDLNSSYKSVHACPKFYPKVVPLSINIQNVHPINAQLAQEVVSSLGWNWHKLHPCEEREDRYSVLGCMVRGGIHCTGMHGTVIFLWKA
jgi:hypothetical protein